MACTLTPDRRKERRPRRRRSLRVMDETQPFVLDLVEQHWCEPIPEIDPSQAGRLRIIISGITVRVPDRLSRRAQRPFREQARRTMIHLSCGERRLAAIPTRT